VLALLGLPQSNEDVTSHPDDRRHRQTRWTGDPQQQLVMLMVLCTPFFSSFVHPRVIAGALAKAQHLIRT